MVAVLHVFAVGLWLGLAGAETIIELRGRRSESERATAIRLHYWMDITIEVPALLVALVTGFMLARDVDIAGWMLVKAVTGTVGIVGTLASVGAVIARYRAFQRGDRAAVDARDALFSRLVAVALASTLVALVIAMARVATR